MPFWAWHGMHTWAGFGWIFPLVGLALMALMAFACLRMIGAMPGFRSMGGQASESGGEAEDLRREAQELKNEIRRIRDRR